ncbi:MAG TPA: 1,2-phenylacetyl-CoA epoxidase subunit PaaC [Terriglobales bacterium]|nr:1,2-phenylacetyl-CoA epoxidase subunit PaaC [Terriglobales bacterium]HVA64583.1 1,2-phenylacetyl-CoA epoxidase subunit PaaC [Terriglobales bacterium]
MAAPAVFEFCLRLGDNDLILSQRLGEWCGRGPVLEEDLALTNVALDLLGQARLWLSHAASIEGRGRNEDQLAFLRDAGEFRNLLLVEEPNGDYAHTMARQYYFDAWHLVVLDALSIASDASVRDIAAKAVKEVAYHLQRSRDWMIRLGDGTEESHRRLQAAADQLWPYTGEMFAMDEVEASLGDVGCDLEALRAPWREEVQSTFARATLAVPAAGWMQRGGKQGVHSEKLGLLLAEMQFLQRAYPGAQW